ncbi:MAG: hypothetical protein HYR95_01090 [Candidatus Colwellbacteria bacterium]|nr:hypothetical protein [Candidatus Colwellbacteria bacterium]
MPKGIKLKKIIYPVILVLVLMAAGLASLMTISFLSKQINGAFTIDEESVKAGLTKFDLNDYKFAVQKLNPPEPTHSKPEE